MRLAFITPSIGLQHGIGDYTRLIATECARLGHEIQIYAINEPHSDSSSVEAMQAGGKMIELHRWGQHLPYERKCREMRAQIQKFRPDWISLQFEFYCYARRGSIWGLMRHLPPALEGRRVQVTVHELWTQLHAAGNPVEWLKGGIRYAQTRQLFNQIKPAVVHTSVELYARRLRHLFPAVKLLPIPSNIPVERSGPGDLPEETASTLTAGREKYLFAILFGRIIPEFEGCAVLQRIDDLARGSGREVRLISIGGCGYNDQYWKKLIGQMPQGWQAIKLGIREPDFISRTLQSSDIAISPTPFNLSRKSGTTAAFLEHGLPVLFAEERPGNAEIATNYPDYRHQLFFADQPLPEELLTKLHDLAKEAYPTTIARRFFGDLL